MVKEVKIGEKIYKFKDEYRVIDYLNQQKNPQIQEGIRMQVRMVEAQSSEPKLSNKDILMMPYGEFRQIYNEINKLYGVPSAFSFLETE